MSDPNSLDDEEYIVRLVCRVVIESVETVRLVDELAGAVTMDDWMSPRPLTPTRGVTTCGLAPPHFSPCER